MQNVTEIMAILSSGLGILLKLSLIVVVMGGAYMLLNLWSE